MTSPSMTSCMARRRLAARGIALAGIFGAGLALGGCGLSLIGHRTDPVEPAVAPRAPSPVDRMAEIRALAAQTPGDPYWPYALGQIYVAKDSVAKAEAALDSSLARDPSYAPALSLLSKLYYRQRRHQEAVQMLEAARTAAGPARNLPPALLAGLALHYEALRRPDLARGVIAAVPDRDRDEVASAMVYLTLRGDTPDSAVDLARSSLHDAPKSAVNQNNWGIAKLKAGDPVAARQAFLEAIRIDPSLPGPYYNLTILDKFYVFDDQAADRWWKLYRERSSDDPDSLAATLRKPSPKELVGKGE
jgi:tetratricopeptide (TPR) repeat protein